MKGIEGLPLRYIIIVLVAALVVGIALQFVGTLKVGILGGAEKLQTEVSSSVEKSLDQTGPVVEAAWVCQKIDTLEDLENDTLCKNVTQMFGEKISVTELGLDCSEGAEVYIYANVTDEGGSGINPYTGVFMYANDKSYSMALWKDTIYGPVKLNITSDTEIGIYAKDENGNSQQKYIRFNVTCS